MAKNLDLSEQYRHKEFKMFSILLQCKIQYGQALYICGDSNHLGQWNPEKAIRMNWNINDLWSVQIVKHDFKYKYFISDFEKPFKIYWEAGPNRKIEKITKPRIIDVWNHRGLLFICDNPSGNNIYLFGTYSDFKNKLLLKNKKNISYLKTQINIQEMKQMKYQLQLESDKNTFSKCYNFDIETAKQFRNNYCVLYCKNLFSKQEKIYKLNENISYGFVPQNQQDFENLKQANIHYIVEFQNIKDDNYTHQKEEETNTNSYLILNMNNKKDWQLFQKFFNIIQILILKYKQIYLCNNSILHLRKYLQIYEHKNNIQKDTQILI